MLFNLIIKEEAHQETIEAYNYYEEQLIGLGERFLNLLQKRYTDLSNHPAHYGFINNDENLNLREVLLAKFPFVVVFEIIHNDVVVYAIHNTHRHPKNKIRK